jgi:hypothetical protein
MHLVVKVRFTTNHFAVHRLSTSSVMLAVFTPLPVRMASSANPASARFALAQFLITCT